MSERSSRIPKFRSLDIETQSKILQDFASLDDAEVDVFKKADTSSQLHNYDIGIFALPIGIATNFKINGNDYLIPMAIEEASVVAAASNGARFFRDNSGITTYPENAVVHAGVSIPFDRLETETIKGEVLAKYIVEAGVFALVDPYRSATHNKGILNGIDAVIMSTGNFVSGYSSEVHSFAASKSGHYTSLTRWEIKDESLIGTISLPYIDQEKTQDKTALVCRKVLGNPNNIEFTEILAAVGLIQNFSALRAMCSEGIQKGHMRQHAASIAMGVGAVGDEIIMIAQQMIDQNMISNSRATEILEVIRGY